MTTEQHQDTALLRRLVAGEPGAETDVAAAATTSRSVPVLVAAAVVGRTPGPLARADGLASSPRERQLVALGHAYLDGPADRLDALVRDHLVTYPDHLLVAWLAGRPR